MNDKLKNIGASILWVASAGVVGAQGYRAIAYYIFDKPIDWQWVDAVVFGLAILGMFMQNQLKTIVVDTAKRLASKK